MAEKKVRSTRAAHITAIENALLRDPDAIGPKLGDISYKAGVPAGLIATILEVTETSVYRWFWGTEPRKQYRRGIKSLCEILTYAVDNGYLPQPGTYPELMQHITQIAQHLHAQKRLKERS